MECPFVVDQKVVCIAASWEHVIGNHPPAYPQAGEIYVVSEIGVPLEFGFVCVRLKEFGPPYYFSAHSFRPLLDRPKEADTDISVFAPLLKVTGPWGAPEPNPVKVPELEPAGRGCEQ